MKAKLTALIIDQNPDQAAQMNKVIVDLFNRVFTLHDPLAIEAELKDTRPNVIFVNLTINQRSAHFEMMEKIPRNEENPVIFFGYNDGQEAELLAASVLFKLKVTAVDESGITLQSEHYINKGTVFPIEAPLIKEIFDTDRHELMVTRTWVGDNWGEFYLFAEPKDPKENNNAALRKFVLRKI